MENFVKQGRLICMLLEEHERKMKDEERKRAERIKFENEEEKALVKLSWITFSILGMILILAAVLIIYRHAVGIDLIWTSILAGIAGSTCSALLSALERKANGWEDKYANKYPSDEPKNKFSKRMATFFYSDLCLGYLPDCWYFLVCKVIIL